VVFALAGALVLAGLATTVGYVEQRQMKIELSGPDVMKCDKKGTITAKVVRLKNGKPVANQAIEWSLAHKASPSDRLNHSESITNKTGEATVKLIFGPKAGKRTIKAVAEGQKPQITLRCSGGLG
jgi:hypothetical protein